MKRIVACIIALSAAVAFVSCSNPKDNNHTIRSGRGTGTGGAGAGAGGVPGAAGTQGGPQFTTPQSTGQLGWGQVTPTDNNAAKAFLSTDFTPDQVGNTVNPCQIGQGLGGGPCIIKFTVTKLPQPQFNPVTLLTGVLTTALNSTTPVYTSDGFLTLVVWDSISGTNPTNDSNFPQGYPPIPVVIPLSSQNTPSATINGVTYSSSVSKQGVVQIVNPSDQVNLFFGDNEGLVAVLGNVQGNQLSGVVEYQNLVTKNQDGSQSQSGASGTLGNFQINLCDIMAPCQ